MSEHAVRRRRRGDTRALVLLLAPGLALFGLFTVWPILYSLYLSVHGEGIGDSGRRFVGLRHYAALLTDPDLRQVFFHTLFYATTVVVVAQSLALGLALLLNRPIPGRVLWRALAFSPCVTTPVAAALVWVLLLDPVQGPLSFVYSAVGVDGPRWLGSSRLALWAITLVGMWKEIAFATVFFLAGLQTIPADLYEAFAVESRSVWGRFRHITVPMLSPVIYFLVISGFISATKAFDVVAVMTQGGPVYPDSSLYVYHLYRTTFYDFTFAYASAMAVAFFLLSLILVAVKFLLGRQFVHYEN